MGWPVRTTTLGPIAGGTALFVERGTTYITAIAKASFAMVHEGLAVQVQAEPLVATDERLPGSETLARASEVAPFLPGVDVLLSGHARALNGKPRPAVATRLVIAAPGDGGTVSMILDKTVHAYGRRETRDAYPDDFASLPLGYDVAEKPTDDFPVGVGSMSSRGAPRLVLPNGARGFGAFGAVAPHWPTRASLIENASLERKGETLVLSDGFPFEFFHAAPPDQRVARLRGGEWVIVDGMHNDLVRFATKLPFTHAEAQLYDETGKPTPITLVCDTLSIDMDERLCTLLFRGHVAAPSERLAALSVVTTVEVLQEAPDAHEMEDAPRHSSTAPPPPAHKTVPPPEAEHDGHAMPFRATPRAADAPPRQIASTVGLPFGRPLTNEPSQIDVSHALRTRPPPRFDEDSTPDHTVAGEADDLSPETRDIPGASAPSSSPPSTAPPEAEREQASEMLATETTVEPARVEETGIRGEVLGKLARNEAFYDTNLAGADLSGIDFTKAAMSGVNLTGAKLVGCKFDGARLGNAKLVGADLSSASLRGADLATANLTKAQLGGASFEEALLTDANLTLANGKGAIFDRATGLRAAFAQGSWQGASFKEVDLGAADFTGADVSESTFDRAKLVEARFSDARAKVASFQGADLEQASFQDALFDDATFDDAAAKRSTWERATLERCTFRRAILEKANFAKTTIKKATFDSADLQSASLIGATSTETSFREASLVGADARQTKLSDPVFEKADLRRFNAHKSSLVGGRFDGANLGAASLRGARLKGSSFVGADLADADLRDADLENANLRDVRNRASAKLGGANLRGAEAGKESAED